MVDLFRDGGTVDAALRPTRHSSFRWTLQSVMVDLFREGGNGNGVYWYLVFVLVFGFGGSFLLRICVIFTNGERVTPDLIILSWVILSSPGVPLASTGRISCTSASPFWLRT